MSIGTRIRELRKQNNFSQEYVAEQLNISRQAVYKWEKDLSKPDTKNMMKLAEVLGSSVEYIAAGRTKESENATVIAQPKKERKLTKKQKLVFSLMGACAGLVICSIGIVFYILNQPISWDAGACGGGYATYVFDKYEEDLIEKYVENDGQRENISEVEAVRGTQRVFWKGQSIYLEFDVQYEHVTEGTVVETLQFIGERKWIDTFDWRRI